MSLSKTRSFPLSVVKQPKVEVAEQKTIKDCLLEIARIVHGSLQSKEVLAKQIKQDCGISRKSIDQFMKDVVQRKKMEGDTKVDVELSRNHKLYAYGLGGVGYDDIRQIDMEYLIGSGLGYKFINQPKFVLAGEVGGPGIPGPNGSVYGFPMR